CPQQPLRCAPELHRDLARRNLTAALPSSTATACPATRSQQPHRAPELHRDLARRSPAPTPPRRHSLALAAPTLARASARPDCDLSYRTDARRAPGRVHLSAPMLALLVLAALVTAGSPVRRVLGLLLALPAFLAPFAAAGPLARALLAATAFWGFARIVDLAREPREFGPLRRIAHLLAVVDSRRVVWVTPRLDLPGLAWLALASVLGYMSLWTAIIL